MSGIQLVITPACQVNDEIKGTFSYLDAGGEQTVVELTPTNRIMITGVWIDLVNMTQDGTIKLYYKVDGSTYRQYNEISFTVASDPDGVLIPAPSTIDADWKLTYTEGADEGAARAIPYAVFWDAKE